MQVKKSLYFIKNYKYKEDEGKRSLYVWTLYENCVRPFGFKATPHTPTYRFSV